MTPGRARPASAAGFGGVRAGRRGFAAAVLVLAVLGAATRPAAAAEPLSGVERATAALEREADGLEALASEPRLGGADWAVDLQARLTAIEVRVWRWRATAAESLGSLLGEAVASQVQAAAGPLSAIPALGPAAGDTAEVARLWAVLADWAAYRSAVARVTLLLESLRVAAAPGTVGLPAPGRVCPVAGPYHFEPTWAEERPWGRSHKGEDVHAERGTPLVAIESGTIIQSGWHWSGGYGVYLEGYYSGDVYYYAHMAWSAPGIRPGTAVEVGDLLGWVGSTGNATSPHLHLGWIPDNPGRWVDLDGLADPYPLLFGLCGPG